MSALVQCMNLTKCYVKGKAPAVSDLNLTIERGHIVGLLGPNGSGKTTLIKMMNGLLKPTDGVVLIGGSEPGVETKKHVLICRNGHIWRRREQWKICWIFLLISMRISKQTERMRCCNL